MQNDRMQYQTFFVRDSLNHYYFRLKCYCKMAWDPLYIWLDRFRVKERISWRACVGMIWRQSRVSVHGVKSLCGHFACLCREFEFYEVKKKIYYFSKRKGKYFYTFDNFYSEKSSKRAKYHKSTTMTPICRNKRAITPKWINS